MSLTTNKLVRIAKGSKLEKNSLFLSDCQRNLPLSQLLTYDPSVKTGKRLKDGLKEYLLLIVAAEQALEALNSKNINFFDPLVGENACQIRAVKTALILFKYPVNHQDLLPKIRLIKLKCFNLIKEVDRLATQGASLSNCLKDNLIEIKLTFNEIFLIQSYLLTKVKVLKPLKKENPLTKNEYTDTKKIKEISTVGSMFADKLVSHLRQSLSEYSIRFVQELARQLELDQSVKQMVSTDFVADHRNLKCLPCFWVTKVIMEAALSYKIPIIIHAQLKSKDRNYELEQEVFLYFKATPSGYHRVSPFSLKKEGPAIVLLGSTCRNFKDLPSVNDWIVEITEKGPIPLMLAYAATHRQYPNENCPKKFSEKSVDDKEFEFYKKKAFEWGCCVQNPSSFFLAHAYCDNIGNVLQESSDINNDSDLVEEKVVNCHSL